MSGLLQWPGAAAWVGAVRDRLLQAAGEGVSVRARARPPGAHPAWDELWLEGILGPESRLTPGELVDRLAADLVSRYRAVRAYHAGRPVDPDAYRRRGLLLATPERFEREAREIFAGEEEALAALLPRQDRSLVDSRVGLNLDERFLLCRFTCYTQYGSYFLLALAIQLERATGRPQRHRLQERGVPAVAACDVPLDRLPAAALRQLCCQGIRAALASPGEEPGEEAPITDFGFVLDQPLPPEQVVACRHPREVPETLVAAGDHERQYPSCSAPSSGTSCAS
jgi:hypothetical protein